jgi:hypothetical protein
MILELGIYYDKQKDYINMIRYYLMQLKEELNVNDQFRILLLRTKIKIIRRNII